MRKAVIAAYLLLAFLAPAGVATAQQPSADELAKKLANPVASLISVPFQYNFDYGYGSDDGSKNTKRPVSCPARTTSGQPPGIRLSKARATAAAPAM